MLTITEDAATLVRRLTVQTTPAAKAGLRIIVDPVHRSLSMGVTQGPAPADQLHTQDQARVFLSPAAAHRLQSRTLHAEITDARSVFFIVD
jgi:Fe-S cluster assembly iron-binding protein IscA